MEMSDNGLEQPAALRRPQLNPGTLDTLRTCVGNMRSVLCVRLAG